MRMKGLNRVKVRLSGGREAVYWYAWKGGPRLEGSPGSPEFIASYTRAVEARRAPKHQNLAALATRFRASPEYQAFADSTKRQWAPWLDKIVRDTGPRDIGGLPMKALDDRRVKAELLDWRDQWAAKPRSADYAMQVLSRVLAFGVGRGELAINAAQGVGQLYSSDRGDLIWQASDLERYVAAAKSPEVAHIVPLACVTGLRREDLAGLEWSHIGEVALRKPTGKSRRGKGKARKDAVVPLLPDAKRLLAEIKTQQQRRHEALCAAAKRKGSPTPPAPKTVLSNTRGKAWTVNGLEHQVVDVKNTGGLTHLHLHDARGTFGTRLRLAGLTAPEIADILGWEEDRVERLLATYVDQDTIVLALAERINRNEARPKTPK